MAARLARFAQFVRERMQQAGIRNPSELARLSGLKQTMCYGLLKGDVPRLANLVALAEFFHDPVEPWVMAGLGRRPPADVAEVIEHYQARRREAAGQVAEELEQELRAFLTKAQDLLDRVKRGQ